jgi:hypothetical protein
MAKKKFDPKAKAKRQKVFVAVGGVLLLALLAFQVPRTMKMMKSQTATSSSTPSTTTTSTAAGSTALAPPSLDGSSTAPASASSSVSADSKSTDGVSDPSNPLPPNSGQLVSFSKFKSKDPFHQQISDCAAAGCPSTRKATSTKPASSQNPSSGNGPSSLLTAAKPVAAKVTKATISVNGIASTVAVGASFPSAAPVFTLVSLTRSAAKIGIAGGSYVNGAATVNLPKGKTVTLMNTADGTRYTLRFVSAA